MVADTWDLCLWDLQFPYVAIWLLVEQPFCQFDSGRHEPGGPGGQSMRKIYVDSSRFCHGLMGTFNPTEEGVQHGSTGCCFPSNKGILAPFWSSQVQLEQEDLLADSLKKEIVRRVERDAMEAREEALLLGSGDGKGVRGSPTGYDGLWWIMGMWMIIWMVTWMLGVSEWFWTSIEWYGWLWTMNWWMILHDYWWLHGWFWMMRDD